MSRVYVVNEPMRYDVGAGAWLRHIDLSTAERYGELVHLLPAGRFSSPVPELIAALRRNLSAFTADDFLLLVGDPRAMAWAAVLAHGRLFDGEALKLLSWHQGQYVLTEADVFEEEAA